jgi:hypothetical protein
MKDIILRNTQLQEMLTHWHGNNLSLWSINGLDRRLFHGEFAISKTEQYSEYFKIFEVITTTRIDGKDKDHSRKHFSINPISPSILDAPKCLITEIRQWFEDNMEECKRQVHYTNWFRQLTIDKLPANRVIDILMGYRYDDEEATRLFLKLKLETLGTI